MRNSCCRALTEIILNVSADDPYYCGFSARVPNFVKQGKQKLTQQGVSGDKSSQQQQHSGGGGRDRDGGHHGGRDGARAGGPKYREPGLLAGPSGAGPASGASSAPALAHIPQVQPFWWHSRLYPADINAGNWR